MLQPTLHTLCNSNGAGQTLLVITAEDLYAFALDVAREVKQQNEPEYFTRDALLSYLGVSPRTLWGYENDGIITAEKIGRQKRYLKTSIYEAIETGKLKPLKQRKNG